MNEKVGNFTFKVPEGHPEVGKKIEGTFPYTECVDEDEALAELASRPKLTILSLVNEYLKTSGRANAYQAAVIPYRETVSPEKVQDRMVKDMIRLGMSREAAQNQVSSLFPDAG